MEYIKIKRTVFLSKISYQIFYGGQYTVCYNFRYNKNCFKESSLREKDCGPVKSL